MRAVVLRALPITLAAALCAAPVLASSIQSPPPEVANEQAAAPEFDLDRIREALGRRSLRLDGAQRRFYLRVVGRSRSVYEFFDDRNMLSGPVPDAQMTHQEYVQSITPQIMYSNVGIRPREVLEWAVTSWFLTEAVKYGKGRIIDASTSWERRRIQQQIDRELAALARIEARRKN